MARKGLPWITQRVLLRKKRVQREMSLGLVGCLLYAFMHRYDDQILYPGWLEYYLYIPIIVVGMVLLSRNRKDTIDHFIIFWFYMFMLSFTMFFVSAKCLLVIGNQLYTRNTPPQTKYIQHVENHSGSLVVFNLEGERVKYRGKIIEPQLNDDQRHKKFSGKLVYKEGLLGTYVADRFELIERE